MLVDLTPDEKAILGAMKSKTRYNIRLSARKGVNVRQGSVDEIEIFVGSVNKAAMPPHSLSNQTGRLRSPGATTRPRRSAGDRQPRIAARGRRRFRAPGLVARQRRRGSARFS